MKELTASLAELAPEAASALKVITYFDKLIEHGAGARSVVRGAAVLSGCPAVLVDHVRDVRLRNLPDGSSSTTSGPAEPSWPRAGSRDGTLELWLERAAGTDAALDSILVERALLAAAAALGRTSDIAGHDESALIRVLVGSDSRSVGRAEALRRLRLAESTPVSVVALPSGALAIGRTDDEIHAEIAGRRAGVGPLLPAADAGRSWSQARLAFRLTAEGTPQDPGGRVVFAEHAGGLLTLAGMVRPEDGIPGDVAILESAAIAPWMLETLEAISTTDSVRDAATLLHLHHSTLQERVVRVERELGWKVLTQLGKQRAQLALVMRRIISSFSAETHNGE